MEIFRHVRPSQPLSSRSDNRCVTRRQLISTALIWLALPAVIFLMGWVRWYIGWPMAALVIAGIYGAIRNIDDPDKVIVKIDNRFVWLALLTILYTIFAGIGSFYYQFDWDHAFRNALFRDLVNEPWPVAHLQADGTVTVISYYLGFWLPSALVAKLSGSMLVGNICQVMWGSAGIFMLFLFIYEYLGRDRLSIWILPFMLFFSAWYIVCDIIYKGTGPDLLGYMKIGNMAQFYMMLDRMSIDFSYTLETFSAPDFLIDTMWIYNSGICGLAGIWLLWSCRRMTRHLLLIAALLLFVSPMAAVGVSFIMIYWIIRHWREIVSPANITGVLWFVIVAIYFFSNNNAGRINAEGDYTLTEYLYRLVLYLLTSYLIYLPFIWRRIRIDKIFWLLLATAVIIPLLRLNEETDLGVRVAIPLVSYLSAVILKTLYDRWKVWTRLRRLCFIIVFAIGATWPACYCMYTCYKSVQGMRAGVSLTADWLESCINSDHETNPCYDNFVSEGESAFTRYVMKRDNLPDEPTEQ